MSSSSSSISSSSSGVNTKLLPSSNKMKTENAGRAFVLLEDGNLRTWEDYSAATGSGMKQNIFPKHDMSVVIPKKTLDALQDHIHHQKAATHQKSHFHTNDSFNIKCYTEPGIRNSFVKKKNQTFWNFGQLDETVAKEKYPNYRGFDIKRWK